jgi:hypothetical protein
MREAWADGYSDCWHRLGKNFCSLAGMGESGRVVLTSWMWRRLSKPQHGRRCRLLQSRAKLDRTSSQHLARERLVSERTALINSMMSAVRLSSSSRPRGALRWVERRWPRTWAPKTSRDPGAEVIHFGKGRLRCVRLACLGCRIT